MKILLTVRYYNPHKGGAEKVVEDLAKSLVFRGHEVSVATTFLKNRRNEVMDGVHVHGFKIRGESATRIQGTRREIKRYQDLLISGEYDVIFNYAAQSWTTDLVFPVLDKITAKKFIVPVGYSRLRSYSYRDYFNILPAYLKKYDKVIYHSPNYQDATYGNEVGLESNSRVIPNGALEEEFLSIEEGDLKKKLNITAPHILLSVSHHIVLKGHRFMINAFKKVDREDVVLVIAGDHIASGGLRRMGHFVLDYLYCYLSSKLNRNIKLVHGNDRKLILSLYKKADIYLLGSRVECAPLVMYEAFASKTPVIARNVGNVSDYGDILSIVNTKEEMTHEIERLLDNEEERSALADRAFALWKEEYTWDKIVDEYEKLFAGSLS